MNHNRAWTRGGLLLCVVLVFPSTALALTETEVSEWLLCYACPGEPLTADRCGGGNQMRATIRQLIAEGKSREEILSYFVDRFGEGILTAPPKKGFNLVAYVGPFVGLLLGGVIAVLAVRRWSAAGRRAAGKGDGSPESRPPLGEDVRLRIERELSELDEEG